MSGWFGRMARRIGANPGVVQVARRALPRLDRAVARASGGRRTAFGLVAPTLILTTTGRRSGEPRTTPLLYVRDGDDYVVVASNFGQSRHPAWSHNLLAQPAATVTVGGTTVPVRAVLADGGERERLWPAVVAIWPGYDAYRLRAGREIRVFVLRASR